MKDKDMGPVAKVISAILYRHDPECLASMGAPNDEYNSEAQMIYTRRDKVRTVDDLAKVIHTVFYIQFAPLEIGTVKSFNAIAKEILPFLEAIKPTEL